MTDTTTPTIFFVRYDPNDGPELWATDGVPGHEYKLTEAVGDGVGTNPANLTLFGDTLFFSGYWYNGVTPYGVEVGWTDGTTASLLTDINYRNFNISGVIFHDSGPDSDPSYLTVAGNHLFFFAYDGNTNVVNADGTLTDTGHGYELWVTDGTAGGTHLVKDILPGPQPGLGGNNPDPYGIAAVGNEVYFVAVDPSDTFGGLSTHDYALWKSDGTEAGTVIVKNISVGDHGDPGIAHLTAANGKLFFTGNDGANGNELWVTDGTADGTFQLTDRLGSLPSDPTSLFNANGILLFSAIDAAGAGAELMRSDGTVAGTVLLKDINPGASDSAPADFVIAGGFTYFTADDGAHGRALWRTDGTADGTVMVSPANPIGPLVDVDGTLFFAASDGVHGSELWKWNGADGATMVADLQPGAGSSNPTNLIAVGNTLYFTATGPGGFELWKSDGSADGTVALSPATNGPVAALAFDTTAPAVVEALANDTGLSPTDEITTSAILTGSGDPDALVRFTVDGIAVATTVIADASGHWTFTPTGLADGSHTIVASETDAAGNTGTASLTFTLDTAAPLVAQALAHDTGMSSTDKLSSDATLAGSGDPNATVFFAIDGHPIAASATADAAGHWAFAPTGLADGSHTIVASETDAAGNTGTASLTFVLDTTAPVTAIADIVQTGNKKVATTTISGTSEAGSAVALYENGSGLATAVVDSAGHWSISLNGLADTLHTFSAVATDTAGNVGAFSNVAIFGSTKADMITGVAGGGLIVGAGGNDTLVAGAGSDTLVFHSGFGKDTVANFDLSHDSLAFDHTLFASAQAVLAHTSDFKGNAVVSFDGADSVTLVGITTAQLSAHLADIHVI